MEPGKTETLSSNLGQHKESIVNTDIDETAKGGDIE